MGWLITLGVVVLLAVLPLGVNVNYDSRGPLIRIIAGPVKITVFPLPKKEKKEKKNKNSGKKAASKAADSEEPQPPKPPTSSRQPSFFVLLM